MQEGGVVLKRGSSSSSSTALHTYTTHTYLPSSPTSFLSGFGALALNQSEPGRRAPSLQEEDLPLRVLGEAVGQVRAGAAASDDDDLKT